MLSAESLKQIDIELAKYPTDQRRSAIMGALRIAQTEKGWLAPETIAFVADYDRHFACTSLRSRYFLQYVRPRACRQIQIDRLYQPALRPARRHGYRRISEEKTRYRLRRKPRPTANLPLSKANAWAHVATLRSCWSTTTACAAL